MPNAFNFFKLLIPLTGEKKRLLFLIQKMTSKKELKELKYLIKQEEIDIRLKTLSVSKGIADDYSYPLITSHSKDIQINNFITELNKKIEQSSKSKIFSQFNPEKILGFIAGNIVGFLEIKQAALLQLFSEEKLHILLLGDPGTGKTEILRSIHDLSPISSFGLGSGTTGAGLTVAFQGKEISKGLLPMADKGICCIDELNLLKKEDVGSLYNAMEKGFVTYNKGGKSVRFDARVKILATANPKGDKFSEDVKKVKDQLPFDQALLSRFHLIFFIKKPSKEKLLTITKKILRQEKPELKKEDLQFIKDYIEFSKLFNVSFEKSLEKEILLFIDQVKDDEKKFLIEINPRIVVGIMNMAKAKARMHLRNKVEKQDLDFVLGIFRKSLYESY